MRSLGSGPRLCGTALLVVWAAAGCREPGGDVLIIGHRGASGYAPEHTFASWDLALEMGVDYLEQDLQMSADGHLIVMHDETLDRTARGSGCTGLVIQHTLAQLRQCDVGSWFNQARADRARAEFANERIPTLDAVLERYAGRARFYIETKNPQDAPGMEDALLALLDKHGLLPRSHDDDRVIVQSFSTASLRRMRELNAMLPLVQLIPRETAPDTLRVIVREVASFAQGIGPHYSLVDAGLVADAHAHDLVIHAYTVNTPAEFQRLIDLGVDGVFTDYPDLRAMLRTEPGS